MYKFLILICLPLWAGAENIATFKKKGGKTAHNITLDEVRMAYQVILRASLNAPSREQFLQDYIRYRVAVEEAYNDRSLVKSPQVRQMIVPSDLRESFNEILYRAYAEKQIQGKISQIEKDVQAMTEADLRKHYNQNPYFSFNFIIIDIPPAASKKQISSIKKRAESIYNKVKSSKKPFLELISLYSDNQYIGRGVLPYSKSALYPLIYSALQALKPQQISQPVRTPNGFYILKLNSVLSFDKANQDDLKKQLFTKRRTKMYNQHFNQLLSQYEININQKALKTL